MQNTYTRVSDLPVGGWRQRSEKALARHEAKNSPLARAVARARAAIQDVSAAEAEGHRRFAEQNAPVVCPMPAQVHPQVAAAILEFMADKRIIDPLMPITETVPLSAFIAIASAEARVQLAQAQRDLAQAEARDARFTDLLAAGPDGLADALQDAGQFMEPAEDETAPSEGQDAPRRGRPRKDASE